MKVLTRNKPPISAEDITQMTADQVTIIKKMQAEFLRRCDKKEMGAMASRDACNAIASAVDALITLQGVNISDV